MRLLVVADLHGAYERLGRFLRDDDVLISLGDHINILDYKDLTGLLASFVDKETIAKTLELIQGKQLDRARAAMTRAAGSIPNLFGKVAEAAHQAYFDMMAAIPCETHFIYGNVDFPASLKEHMSGNKTLHIADLLEFSGRKFGLISGHPPGPFSFGMPGEIKNTEFAQRLHEIGAVDVLCVHSPPAIDGMSFDVVADRDEEGSPDSLYYANLHRPRLVLFGHIHQPRVAEFIDTESPDDPIRFVNVGCFRDTGRVLQIDPATLETQWLQAD